MPNAQRTERAVRRGVAVAAHDGHAGLRQALLGADDVDDAPVRVAHAEELDAELLAVLGEHLHLAWPRSASGGGPSGPVVGLLWSIVDTVRSGRRTVRPLHAQAVERLR